LEADHVPPYLSSRRAWSWVVATMTRRTTCSAGTSKRDSAHQADDRGKPTIEHAQPPALTHTGADAGRWQIPLGV
jgi:hypothetical protein